MTAHRPKTDEAIAMFIDDEKAMWRLMKDAKVVQVAFPTRAAGLQTAVFEVAGLNRTKLPGWDRAQACRRRARQRHCIAAFLHE